MHIEIKSATGSNPRPYKEKVYVEQQAALCVEGADYPLPFKVNRQQGDELKPGRYTFAQDSFNTDQHGNLKLGRVKLVPLLSSSNAAAKAA